MAETAQNKPIASILKELAQGLADLNTAVSDIPRSDLPSLCKAYKVVYELHDALERNMKLITALKEEMSYDILPTAFERQEMDSAKMHGRNFIVAARLYASIPADRREMAHQWLIARGYGDAIVPTINSQTLSTIIKTHIEEKAEEPPEKDIKVHKKKYIRMVKG